MKENGERTIRVGAIPEREYRDEGIFLRLEKRRHGLVVLELDRLVLWAYDFEIQGRVDAVYTLETEVATGNQAGALVLNPSARG